MINLSAIPGAALIKDVFYASKKWWNEPTWSTLATIGNTQIAKLCILAPILAQYIIFSEKYSNLNFFSESFQFNIYLLYWSLLSISAAQILYLACAPYVVRNFGAGTNFVASMMNIGTESRADENFFYVLNNLWKLSPTKFKYFDQTWDDVSKRLDPKYKDNPTQEETNILRIQKFFEAVQGTGTSKDVDWNPVRVMFEDSPSLLMNNDPKDIESIKFHKQFIDLLSGQELRDGRYLNQDTRKIIYTLKYELKNRVLKNYSRLILVLYALGFVYFIIKSPIIIGNIFLITVGLLD